MTYSHYRIKKTDLGFSLSRFCEASEEWWHYETYSTLEEAEADMVFLKTQTN